MYTLKFTLKQHTPLIHFQHHQDGATLRASEVKPKLDRFLIEQNRTTLEKLIKKTPSNHEFLDYKMRIETDKSVILPDDLPCFFGNMGESEHEKKKLITYFPQGIRIEISSYSQVLLNILEKNLNAFFTLTHFGTRQSKGFGLFSVEKINEIEIKDNQFETILKTKYTAIYKKQVSNTNYTNLHEKMKNIFGEIDKEYKKLKTGSTTQNSKLRDYFNSKRPAIEWEKPTMQEYVNNNNRKQIGIKSISTDRQYIRAILGLAQTFEYPHNGKIKFTVKHNETDENKKIERFQSPIHIKYCEGNIYFCANELNSKQKDILDKRFLFNPSKENGTLEGKAPIMYTPNEFKLLSFLENSLTTNFIKL